MSRTIVVGLDGTPESVTAADWAAREAVRTDARLHVVHVWLWQPLVYAPLAGVSVPPAVEESQRAWAENLPRETAARLTLEHPGLAVSAECVSDQPAGGLLAAAKDAELLVLGSRGLSGVHGFLVGSVALSVAARSRTPLVLVRAETETEAARAQDAGEVVLGLDLDHPDAAVIEFAFEAAARRSVGLRVLTGWTLPAFYGFSGASDATVNAELLAAAQHRLTEVVRPWREKFPAVDVREQSVSGGAGPALVDASRNAGLVVVGRKNRSAPVGAHIGPVTQAVLHHSVAPVAVIPHD
ncbi:universal stress protein [Streptomyces sp. NPDC007084]|uniref:universal stress protein n=1 Tax=Streptomyces sp. NPDC007084 TaxID=3154313 RepID=UPI0034559202